MTSPKRCYAHQHMTAITYAVYDVCTAMSTRHKGTVYFSGPKIAKKFLSMGQNTPYKAAKYLVDKGWFKLIRESRRRADGTHAPTLYKVVDHEEWVAEHPGCCVDSSEEWRVALSPSHSEGTDNNQPSHPGEHRHTMGDDHHTMDNDHHTQSEQTYKKQPIQTTNKSTNAYSQPFTPGVTESIFPNCDGANVAPAPPTRGEPFTQDVMDEPDTGPLGLIRRNGEWFTESGGKVHPDAVAVLLEDKGAA